MNYQFKKVCIIHASFIAIKKTNYLNENDSKTVMTKSTIEITENAYFIRLDKSEFEYPVVRKLLNRLLNDRFRQESGNIEDDLSDRYLADFGDRFDFLEDK